AEDFRGAESFYRQVLEKQPKLAGANYALGHVLLRQGREGEALKYLEQELEQDSFHYLALYEAGSILARRGETPNAVELLRKSVELRPSFDESKVELAKVYMRVKRGSEAVLLLKDVIRREPGHATAHYLLFRAYSATGQDALAKRELKMHRMLLEKRKASGAARAAVSP
ncbi:MAG: tetratricopeptide repeat protein, partial [Bryobacteraceae bacterium]